MVYKRSKLVTYLSRTEHPGYSGKQPFDASYASGKDSQYVKSLAALSAIAISTGFFAILIYCGILCARRGIWKDKEFSRFSIGFTLDTDTYRLRSKGSRPVRFVMIIGFVSSVMLMFGCFSGSVPVSSSVASMSVEASKVAKIFTDLDTSTASLVQDYSTNLQAAATAGQCGTINTASLKTSTDAAALKYKGVGALTTKLSKVIASDGSKFVSLSVQLLSAFVLIPAGLGIGGAALSRSDLMLGASACGIGILAFLVISMAIILSLSVVAADYCMAPDSNTLSVLTALGKTNEEKLAKYFIRCAAGSQNEMQNLLGTVTTNLNTVNAACAAPAFKAIVSARLAEVATASTALTCSAIQKSYQTATYVSLCTTAVKGIYHLWVVQATTGVVFLTTLIFSAFVNLDKTDAEMEDDEDTPTARSRRRRRLKEKRRKSRERKKSQAKERLIDESGVPVKSSRSSRSSRHMNSDADSVTSLSTTDEEEILV